MGPDDDLLGQLLDDTGELGAVLGPDRRLRYLNPAGRRLLGLTEATALPEVAFDGLVADLDRAVLEVDLLPALAATGRWSGALHLLSTAGLPVPTRSTLRAHGTGAARRLTWVARDVSTERAIFERLHKKVFEDDLTGLPHRSIFLDRLDLCLRRTDPAAPTVTLLSIALHQLRARQDRLPASARGDLLRAVAERVDGLRGDRDSVTRWGDDELVVLREGGDDEALVAGVAAALARPFLVAGTEVFVPASLGVAQGRPGTVTTDQLLRQVDAASQAARQRGGGAVQRFEGGLHDRARRRAELEDALRGAAGRGELLLHFQPEVSLRTNQIVAVESLVRWQHPSWGLVGPSEFIPVAEASNLILELGRWVLETATEQCGRWRSRYGDRRPVVGVNISGRQFEQDDFVGHVAEILARSGAEPGDLCLEITESTLMADVERTVATLQRLKALGVQLAVDDFGTGYSSLSYLRRFPVDVLKVDQSFVNGLGHDPEDSAIVQAVVAMGRALRLTTVAEGVETGHHVIELRELDCDLAQGYHFARPVAAEVVSAMLDAGSDWQQVAG